MTEHAPHRARCPGCDRRRLSPLPPASPHHVCRWCCPVCGTTGFKRVSDGFSVWSLGGDGSLESRQARATYKIDGFRQMKKANAATLPGIES